ncbi:RNA recognition motif domain-containing protein [Niabella sp. CJ426]|jgi:RNA recognition motif-containing protein|uniref:RNA-binding protein n=1 Tax=Niabella yanshanensis TaxID=577386 RepID=A0ABZ0VZS9_9BACT|nr:RNA-binding protein [Niabella yanshanensis]WQD36530.1 RNA-binding protein [Niabella yanshanensis]
MNIFVSNLGYSFSTEDLNELFSSYGAVDSARVITDKFTQQSRGFGFVEMSDEDSALKAIKDLNGTMQDGRSIKVAEARPKEEKTGYSNRW